MSKVVAVYRVKNEVRWIRESLERTLHVADEAIVLDDHSNDGTPDIASSIDARVSVVRSGFRDVDEARDRETLLRQAVARGADWILTLDGDEVLTPTAIAECKRILEARKRAAWFMRVAYLWNDRTLERVDGCYGQIFAPVLYSVHGRGDDVLRFRRTEHAANMHCGRLPDGYCFPSYYAPNEGALVKHYGYMIPADRQRKYEFYVWLDNANGLEREGHYRHILGEPSPHAPGPVALRPFVDR